MKTKAEKTKTLVKMRQLAVGYIRVSTQDQGTNGVGLEAQRAGINAFAKGMNYRIIEIFSDVASGMGAKSVEDRAGLQRALQVAVERDAWLIVDDWSRLTRHAASVAEVIRLLTDPSRILDAKTGTNLHQAVKAGEVARSELVGKEIGRRTREGMKKLRDQGAVFGNPNIRAVQEKGAAGVSDKAARLYSTIAEKLRSYGSGHSELTAAQVADMLNDTGLLTGSEKPWNKTRVRLPLTRARKLLDDEEDRLMRESPTFGAF